MPHSTEWAQSDPGASNSTGNDTSNNAPTDNRRVPPDIAAVQALARADAAGGARRLFRHPANTTLIQAGERIRTYNSAFDSAIGTQQAGSPGSARGNGRGGWPDRGRGQRGRGGQPDRGRGGQRGGWTDRGRGGWIDRGRGGWTDRGRGGGTATQGARGRGGSNGTTGTGANGTTNGVNGFINGSH